MPALMKRGISALAAIAIIGGAYYWIGHLGLLIVGLCLGVIGVIEYSKMTLKSAHANTASRVAFFLLTTSVLLGASLFSYLRTALGQENPTQPIIYIGATSLITLFALFIPALIILLWALMIWINRNKVENQSLLNTLSASTIGFVYCGLCPGFALACLGFRLGSLWFFSLLSMVFIGDIAAYFGGITFGKRKLMPNLSPNKTIAGFVSSLFASIGTGVFIGIQFLPDSPIVFWVITSVVVSLSAQTGDLFESLIKRVNGVKDSGAIMPGHGGALDRLDGLYFGAPLMFMAALAYEALLAY